MIIIIAFPIIEIDNSRKVLKSQIRENLKPRKLPDLHYTAVVWLF